MCGKGNSSGLRISFRLEGEELRGSFRPDSIYQGFDGIVHGGILASVLDDAMVNLLWLKGTQLVSAVLKVRYYRMAKVGEELQIKTWLEKKRYGVYMTAGVLTDPEGHRIATAEARLMSPKI